jgi:hypothetical protein
VCSRLCVPALRSNRSIVVDLCSTESELSQYRIRLKLCIRDCNKALELISVVANPPAALVCTSIDPLHTKTFLIIFFICLLLVSSAACAVQIALQYKTLLRRGTAFWWLGALGSALADHRTALALGREKGWFPPAPAAASAPAPAPASDSAPAPASTTPAAADSKSDASAPAPAPASIPSPSDTAASASAAAPAAASTSTSAAAPTTATPPPTAHKPPADCPLPASAYPTLLSTLDTLTSLHTHFSVHQTHTQYKTRGNECYARGAFQEAVDWYGRSLRVDSCSVVALSNRAMCALLVSPPDVQGMQRSAAVVRCAGHRHAG